MILKIGLYLLMGLVLNAVISFGFKLWIATKCVNDPTDRIFNDLYAYYIKQLIIRTNSLAFWKRNDMTESEENSALDNEARGYLNFAEENLRGGFLLFAIVFTTVLWPVEVFYVKAWTIPRTVEYAKKYGET